LLQLVTFMSGADCPQWDWILG